VSVLILSAYFVSNMLLGDKYWGVLHSGSQTGFFAWMVLGLLFALNATLRGSRWWLIAVAFVLASTFLLRPVVFACPVWRWHR
jgi:hypothetical protein